MTELWSIHVRANMIMGDWRGEIIYFEPDGDGGFSSTRMCGFTAPMAESPDAIADALAVLEHAHAALTDAASAST